MWKAKFIFKDCSKEELLCSRCEAIEWQHVLVGFAVMQVLIKSV